MKETNNYMEEMKDISIIENLKEIRFDQIDKKTLEMINSGFVFDGELFSLSMQAQSNWTNIKASKVTFAALGMFPMSISTKNNNTYLLEESSVEYFWGSGLRVVKNAYEKGRGLKKLIFDATTIEEVNAVIDER